MEVYSIGFGKHSAAAFFGALKAVSIQQLVDVRLNNVSQLAGFAKSGDLPYFLREICGASYEHEPRLAPSAELLDAYRAKEITWDEYEPRFFDLMRERDVPAVIERAPYETKTVLLCSEATPDKCHRRLVAGLMARAWGATIEHL